MAVVGLILIGFTIWRSPVYSFHPTCTYTVNARVIADVDIEGEKLSAAVVHQNSRSRRWIAMMNSAGCQQQYGDALTYRLSDDRVLIIPSRLCRAGERALAQDGQVDILRVCTGKEAVQGSAFMVDFATRPGKWRTVTNGVDFRIIRMTAASTWSNPTDDIASIAPNLLKSAFTYDRNQWWYSPERIINFQRRYNEVRHRPGNSFEFEVQYEKF
ncbi:MAG: hypothetical protein APF80_10575 [Alphaproteobacteria bacterium BRH_c36]|nr:MAG: hypothetical protein APF80_10575 [Alphaproteobacteria bacterium BRH_c36]